MAGIIVAIDGPSGSGKSSTAKTIAKRANWSYLDTGALYRAATWLAIKNNISEGWQIIAALKDEPIVFKTDPDAPEIFCGDVDITTDIRSLRITDQVSIFSQIPELRDYLVSLQRTVIEEAPLGAIVLLRGLLLLKSFIETHSIRITAS